jgi:hypothetical protein
VPPDQATLERFFFLDDADRDLVAKRRGDQNRLGFALQLVTVRWLGTFLTDPLDVPVVVLDYVAAQVEVADPSCVKRYTEREKTRLEHQWEIAQVGGFVSGEEAQRVLRLEDRDIAVLAGVDVQRLPHRGEASNSAKPSCHVRWRAPWSAASAAPRSG